MGKKLELPKWRVWMSVYWIAKEENMDLWEGHIRSVDEEAQTATVVGVCQRIDADKQPVDKVVSLDRLREIRK
mgnify:CR=1 FL=1